MVAPYCQLELHKLQRVDSKWGSEASFGAYRAFIVHQNTIAGLSAFPSHRWLIKTVIRLRRAVLSCRMTVSRVDEDEEDAEQPYLKTFMTPTWEHHS